METSSFVAYLRKNKFTILPGLTIVPFFMMLFGWLFGHGLLVGCVTALSFVFWILIDHYGTFAGANNFKKDCIGVSAALGGGYLVFLLFSIVDPSMLGESTGYFMASLSVMFYYLGRYKGINNGVIPFAYKLFGLRVPPTRK